MPLYPPPQLVEHPADLVIDVFGTFLGKRSERMIVRWRDADPAAASIPLPPRESAASATSGSQPVESSALHVPQPSSVSSSDATLYSPNEPGDVSPRILPVLPADAIATSDLRLQTSETRPGTDVARLNLEAPDEDSAQDNDSDSATIQRPVEPEAPETPAASLPHCSALIPHCSPSSPSPADQFAAQLLEIWAQQTPPPETPLPTRSARFEEQLNQVADRSAAERVAGTWQERAVPMSRLRSVTVSGRGITVSSDLIAALVERGIALSFLSGRGQPVAQLSAPGLGGTVQTRRSQLAAYDSSLGVEIAVEFIRGKLRNQQNQLQYSGKYLKAADPPRFERLARKVKSLSGLRKQLIDFKGDKLDSVRDKLMGYEGTGARLYWEGVAIILEGRIDFPGRSTRGALDPVNSALNYGYGILYGQVSAAVVNAGLELYAGFLHVDRPGKPALVLDLVEEFRAPIVDRAILAIVNQGIDIETDDHGLIAATRKLVAQRVLERLSTPVPYEGKRWPLRTIIQNQARHLAVAVRGEREYRAFASRW